MRALNYCMENPDMKQCTLDCAGITEPEVFHDALVEALVLPDWYGTNLDALYDCLTSITEETCITLRHFDNLGRQFSGFASVFQDAVEANPRLHIEFH